MVKRSELRPAFRYLDRLIIPHQRLADSMQRLVGFKIDAEADEHAEVGLQFLHPHQRIREFVAGETVEICAQDLPVELVKSLGFEIQAISSRHLYIPNRSEVDNYFSARLGSLIVHFLNRAVHCPSKTTDLENRFGVRRKYAYVLCGGRRLHAPSKPEVRFLEAGVSKAEHQFSFRPQIVVEFRFRD